jgi:hypothetical protein
VAAPGAAGARGEGEPGQRGDHHIEAVPFIGPVGGRVGQQRRQLEQLGERARPAVGEHQRERIRAGAPLVHEMHPLAADVRGELGEGVQVLLLGAPVERRRPVGHQLLVVADVCAGRPAPVGQRVRPSGAGQPRPKIVQELSRDLDRKRLRAHHRHTSAIAQLPFNRAEVTRGPACLCAVRYVPSTPGRRLEAAMIGDSASFAVKAKLPTP